MKSTSSAVFITAVAGALALASTPAGADTSIPVVNPQFSLVYESQGSTVTGTIPANTYSNGWGATTFSNPIAYSDGTSSTSGYAPGWTSGGSSGEQNIPAVGTRTAGDYGYAQTTLMSQTLGTDITPGTTYLLSAGADTRYPNGPTTIGLTAGGNALEGVYYGNPGGYQQATAPVYELVTAPSTASGALGIQLGNGSGQSIFNNVTLTANPSNGPTVVNNAFTMGDLGATTPTPGGMDQSNLHPTAAATTSTNPNYYTNASNALPGETFTTGNASSYNLNSITVLDQDEHGGFASGANVTLALYSVSGTNFTVKEVLNGVATGAASGDYVQFALNSPITLQGSSVYGYGIGSSNGYTGLGVDPNADYAGGQLAMFQLGGLGTSGSAPNAIFDVGLTAVPEPATLGILALGGLATMLSSRKKKVRV